MPFISPIQAYKFVSKKQGEADNNDLIDWELISPQQIFQEISIFDPYLMENPDQYDVYLKFMDYINNNISAIQDLAAVMQNSNIKINETIDYTNGFEIFLNICDALSKKEGKNIIIKNFSFYKNEKHQTGVFVYNSNDQSFENIEVFLLNCLQFVLALKDYRYLVISKQLNNTIFQLIQTGFILEMHLYYMSNEGTIPKIEMPFQDILNNETFIYIYTNVTSFKLDEKLSKYIEMIYVKNFDTIEQEEIKSISQTNDGFTIPSLVLFKDDNYINDNIPLIQLNKNMKINLEGKSFQINKNGRVPVILENTIQSKQEQQLYYSNFDDIHHINISHYIKNQLCSSPFLNNQIVEDINQYEKNRSELPKKTNNIFKEIETIANNYSNNTLHIRNTQLYAIRDMVDYVLQSDHKEDIKGHIYQIDTGEGKTLILLAVAILLAKNAKKKVHIITNTIDLAITAYIKLQNILSKCDNFKNIKPHLLISKEKLDSSNDLEEYMKFFDKKYFDESINLNTKICLEKKFSIIISTAFNFEAAYLTLIDKNPNLDFFNNTVCLIDEADSILIDDLDFGTTISKPIKSDVEDAIKTIYKFAKKYAKLDIEEKIPKLHEKLKKNFPTFDEEKQYYKNIEYRQNSSISKETGIQKEKDRIFKLIRQLITEADLVREKMKKNTHYVLTKTKGENFQKITPFDINKGTIQYQKEFTGFIQQFIAAKESKKNQQVLMDPISISYSYISHPMFFKKYTVILGATGTIGDSERDYSIYKEQYGLETKTIPRFQPNYRYDMSPILVDSYEERNRLILREIKTILERKYSNQDSLNERSINKSVLVLLEDPNEVAVINKLIESNLKGEYNILVDTNIETIHKDLKKTKDINYDVIIAGNNYGRGINADQNVNCENGLHVIVGFYSSNSRVINQARGRTGRQGKLGTSKIICPADQYFQYQKIQELNKSNQTIKFQTNKRNNFLIECDSRNMLIQQLNEKNATWIFNEDIIKTNKDIKLEEREIETIRNYEINISRDTAIDFIYPFGFNCENYLTIQSQRIYSLINCPNCVFVWKLISRYYRVMILEGWSLFLENCDDSVDPQKKVAMYIDKLKYYIPFEKLNEFKSDAIGSFKCAFLYLTSLINQENHKYLQLNFAQSSQKWGLQSLYYKNQQKFHFNKKRKIGGKFFAIKYGLYPYTKFYIEEGDDFYNSFKIKENSPIKDKELNYDKISITSILDDVYDMCYRTLDDALREFIGLRLYLKRTVAGTEFGIFFQPYSKSNKNFLELHDINISIIAAINIKSDRLVMLAVLQLFLFYWANFFNCFTNFFSALKLSFKKASKIFISTLFDELIKEDKIKGFFEQISEFITGEIRDTMGDEYDDSIISSIINTFVFSLSHDDFGIDLVNIFLFKLCVLIIMLVAALLIKAFKDYNQGKKPPKI